MTSDSCQNAGACDAACSNNLCTAVCSQDSHCDDSDPSTEDACNNAGTCAASCSHEGKAELSIAVPPGLVGPFLRGQMVDLNISVTDSDGNPVEGATASFTDAGGHEVELQSVGNGVYKGSYSVPVDLPVGEQDFTLAVAKPGMFGSKHVSVVVSKGVVRAVLMKPEELEALPGDKVEFRFSLAYDNNVLVQESDMNVLLNNEPLTFVKTGDYFSAFYLFSEKDTGNSLFSVQASDSFGNEGTTNFVVAVGSPISPLSMFLILLLILALLLAVYGLRKTHRLFNLLRRRSQVSIAKKKAELLKSIAKERARIKKLEKDIALHEKELKKLDAEIEIERKKQALAVRKIPMESKYRLHKFFVSLPLLAKKAGAMLRRGKVPEKPKKLPEIEEIEAEQLLLKEKIQNLESEFCKQNIKEDFFREKLFEYREKLHLSELRKKKLE